MKTKSFEEIHNRAQAAFQGIQLVFEFMDQYQSSVMGVIVRNEFVHRENVLKLLWVRSLSWVKTLSILNHSSSFQAISAANRSLLEISIDLVLLHTDKTNDLGWKMFWFTESELLKDAELITNYFSDKKIEIPTTFEDSQGFIKQKKDSIETMRKSLWKTTKHPKCRWTGSSDLSIDAKKADSQFAAGIGGDLQMGFDEYYQTAYRKLNWDIHSGGTALVNNTMEFVDTKNFLRLIHCANFAILCTRLILTDLEVTQHLNDIDEKIENLTLERGLLILEASSS